MQWQKVGDINSKWHKKGRTMDKHKRTNETGNHTYGRNGSIGSDKNDDDL